MNYDEEKVMTKKQCQLFLSSREKQISDMLITLKTNPEKWESWVKNKGLWYTAQEITMLKYKFGKYKHLCEKCKFKHPGCKADPMFGPMKTNVCYCEKFTKWDVKIK